MATTHTNSLTTVSNGVSRPRRCLPWLLVALWVCASLMRPMDAVASPTPTEDTQTSKAPAPSSSKTAPRTSAQVPQQDPQQTSLSPRWGRPYVLLKAIVGLPDFFGGRVEFLIPTLPLSVEAGGSIQGLLGHVLSLSFKWRPKLMCWGCTGRHIFSIGLGIEGNAILASPTLTGVILAAVVDVFYTYRFFEHFGLVAGLRGGLGITWDVRHGTLPAGTEPTPFKVEPAFPIMFYLGLAF